MKSRMSALLGQAAAALLLAGALAAPAAAKIYERSESASWHFFDTGLQARILERALKLFTEASVAQELQDDLSMLDSSEQGQEEYMRSLESIFAIAELDWFGCEDGVGMPNWPDIIRLGQPDSSVYHFLVSCGDSELYQVSLAYSQVKQLGSKAYVLGIVRAQQD